MDTKTHQQLPTFKEGEEEEDPVDKESETHDKSSDRTNLLSRNRTDDGIDELLEAPKRTESTRSTSTSSGIRLEQTAPPVRKDAGKGKKKRTQSFIQSLPVAVAEPETRRRGSILAYTAEVEPLIDSTTNQLAFGEKEQSYDDDEDNDPSNGVEEGQRRPSLISVRVDKPTADVVLGIGFRSVRGELVVSNITPTSSFMNTSIRMGDRVMSLDHHRNIKHWTGVQAASFVRNAEGLLTLVVRTKHGDPNVAEATVFKQSANDKVGLSFQSENGRLRIANVLVKGLLGNMSVLSAGDYMDTINDVDVSSVDPSLAVALLQSTVGKTTIRVKHTNTTEVSVRDVMLMANNGMSSRRYSSSVGIAAMTADELNLDLDLESGRMTTMSDGNSELAIRPGFVSALLYKPTADTQLGISFMNPEGNQLQICNIRPQGMLEKSPLASGQYIQSICNIRCRQWSKQQAVDFVKAAVGELLIVVRDPLGDPAYAAAFVHKPTPRSKLGVSFKTSNGPLLIGTIRVDGLLCNSVLNSDDTVLSINHIPCQNSSLTEAVAITARNPEYAILLVKPNQTNGIVLSHKSDFTSRDEYDLALQDQTGRHGDQDGSSQAQKTAGICAVCVFVGIGAVILMLQNVDRCGPNEYCG